MRWETIVSAPHDGQVFLGGWLRGDGYVYCTAEVRFIGGKQYREVFEDGTEHYVCQPTHWLTATEEKAVLSGPSYD